MNSAISKLLSLTVLVLAIFLASCKEHSFDEIFGRGSGKNLSSSSSSQDNGSNQDSSSSQDDPSSSSRVIEINDKDIPLAASFAKKFFIFIPFPFIDLFGSGNPFPMTIASDNSDVEFFVDRRNDKNGEAFKSLFDGLYAKKEEILSNGKFKHYIELLVKLIPRKTYIDNGWDTMARQLLIAYEDLKNNPNNFIEIYKIMANNVNKNAVEAYNQILDFVSDPQLEDFILKQSVADAVTSHYWGGDEGNVGDVNRSAVVWAYSFWARRYNENPNNLNAIVDILLMLRDDYPE
jgi:hypothetical protein